MMRAARIAGVVSAGMIAWAAAGAQSLAAPLHSMLFTRLHAIVISTEPSSGGRHTNYGRHRSTISPLGQRICGGEVDAGSLDCAPYRRLAAHSAPTAAHVALTFVGRPRRSDDWPVLQEGVTRSMVTFR